MSQCMHVLFDFLNVECGLLGLFSCRVNLRVDGGIFVQKRYSCIAVVVGSLSRGGYDGRSSCGAHEEKVCWMFECNSMHESQFYSLTEDMDFVCNFFPPLLFFETLTIYSSIH